MTKRAPERLKICVLGMGYVGLPTAALFASRGAEVHGVDVKPEVIDTINDGKIHIVEPDLDMLVQAATQTKMLRVSSEPVASDVFIIAVPTPLLEDVVPPRPCIDYVIEAARSIAPFIAEGNLVILESTSPLGTTRQLYQVLKEEGVKVDRIHLAYCPERVLPGRVIIELVENDRVVGGINEESALKAKEFYSHFVMGSIHTTTSEVAEMVKLTENAYRDVNIAFANEISIICDNHGIDPCELIQLANCHPRVNVLKPGCGVGGHCIAVDPWFIVSTDPDDAQLIRQARETNDYKSRWVVERIKSEYRALDKAKPVVALFGLAFKPDIDDLRSSPALRIAQELSKEKDADFLYVEPNVQNHVEFELTDWEKALVEADLIVRLVGHTAFSSGALEQCSVPILDFVSD